MPVNNEINVLSRRAAIRFSLGLPALLALLLAFTPLPLLAAPAEPGGPPPPMVVTAPVTEADIVPATEYIGHVEAIQTVELRARVEGFLQQVQFVEGGLVRAGDILYVIEPDAYRARVAADQARIDQARAELIRAGQHLKRLQAARADSIPGTDLDNALAAELSAKATLAGAEASLALSQLNLDYTTIKAPISGRIGRTAYSKGNLLNPGSGTLASIVQTDPIRVVYSISENDLTAIQKAMTDSGAEKGRLLSPQIRLSNGELLADIGQVSFVDNQVDPSTGTIAIRAEFPNARHQLIPGQYVSVLVKATAARVMPIVPQAAVLVNQEGRFVLMVHEGLATPRAITTGMAVGANWAVESGLKAGEEIIVQGIQKVQPGQPVQVAPPKTEGK